MVGRTLHRTATDDRADGDGVPPRGEPLAHAGNGQQGADRDDGVARADQHDLGLLEGLEHARSGRRALGCPKVDAADVVGRAVAHQVLLEVGGASVAADHQCGRGVLGHRQQLDLEVEGARDLGRHLAERRALAESGAALHVRGQVAVAEREPGVVAEASQRLQQVEALAREAPAGLAVDQARQCVGDDVEVGTDAQPEEVAIVARVHDDAELPGWEHADQPVQEAGGADPTRESDHAAGHGSSDPIRRAARRARIAAAADAGRARAAPDRR